MEANVVVVKIAASVSKVNWNCQINVNHEQFLFWGRFAVDLGRAKTPYASGRDSTMTGTGSNYGRVQQSQGLHFDNVKSYKGSGHVNDTTQSRVTSGRDFTVA